MVAPPCRTLRVLVVSECPGLLEALGLMLEDPRVELRTDPREVVAELASGSVDGLIVDGALPRDLAVTLAGEQLRHQPLGRVAILATDEDAHTLVGIALRDPRCDLFFPPYDPHALLNFLRMTACESLRNVPEPAVAG